MQSKISYSYGAYNDNGVFVIDCLNNDNLFGISESKEAIKKNAIDFTSGILESCIKNKIEFPSSDKVIKDKKKYNIFFNLSFDLKTGKNISKKQTATLNKTQ